MRPGVVLFNTVRRSIREPIAKGWPIRQAAQTCAAFFRENPLKLAACSDHEPFHWPFTKAILAKFHHDFTDDVIEVR
jgi:hypothetical protein